MLQMRKILCLAFVSFMAANSYAQFDTTDDEFSDDLGLYYDEEEEEKPQHREFKNMIDVQYAPSKYTFHGASPRLHTQGFALGWNRSIQVQENTPLFVEAGVQMKYDFAEESLSHGNASYQQLAFRIPVNVVYKFYLSKTKDIALAPMAGVFAQLRAMGREKIGGQSRDIVADGITNTTGAAWKRFDLGWQAGVKMCLGRYYLGFSYAQDFPDRLVNDDSVDSSLGEDKQVARMHEFSLHAGICF